MKHTRLAFSAALVLLNCTGNTLPLAAENPASLAPTHVPIIEGLAVLVVAHPDQQALLQSNMPQLAANRRRVYDLWRTVILAGQLDRAETFLTVQ